MTNKEKTLYPRDCHLMPKDASRVGLRYTGLVVKWGLVKTRRGQRKLADSRSGDQKAQPAETEKRLPLSSLGAHQICQIETESS